MKKPQCFRNVYEVEENEDWDYMIYEASSHFQDMFKVWPHTFIANPGTLDVINHFLTKKFRADKQGEEVKRITTFRCSKFELNICADSNLENHQFGLVYEGQEDETLELVN